MSVKKNKKIVIIDLKDNKDYIIKNCDIIKISSGFLKTENENILNIGRINDKKLKNYKKKLLNKLSKYKNYISSFKEIDTNLLEIFNLRNDKIKLYDKIFYTLHINDFLKKKKYEKILIVTDQPNIRELYKIFKIKNSKIIFLKNKRKINYNLFFFNRINFFYLKMFFFLIYIKIFLNSSSKNKKKILNEACLSLYPQYFSSYKNFFYKKKLFNINFLITDESHLGNTLYKNISQAKKLNKLKNTIIAERYITFLELFLSYKKSLKILLNLNKILNKKIYFNKIEINLIFRELLVTSLINYSKLTIYDKAINSIFKENRFSKFHYYLFEYNFGFYLNSKIKKFNSMIKTVGYQHGIFSEQLMWLSLINKYYLPDKIILKYNQSKKAYKRYFSKVTNQIKNSFNSLKYEKIIDINKKNENVFVYLGLHDSKDMIHSIVQNIDQYKHKKVFLISHPKSKKIIVPKLPKNIFLNKKINCKINYFLLSSTSTMVYDFISKKIPFKILIPNYLNALTSEKISKKYNIN